MSIYIDVYEPVESGVPKVDITTFKKIDVENLSVKEFHNTLDFNVKPPLLVVSQVENEITSYLRALRGEYSSWKIVHVIKPHAKNIPFELPENEPEIKIENDDQLSVLRIKAIALEQPMYTFSPSNAYVITGGFGYIGMNIAQYLFDNGARNIVFISSTKNSLPLDWNKKFIPQVLQCDVSNKNDVERTFQKIGTNIAGVIHAAGVAKHNLIKDLQEDDWTVNFSAKVNGANYILECLENMQVFPEFIVLCSSISSSFVNEGLSVYAAANGALDKIARERKNVVSIRWGAWSGGGMAIDQTHEFNKRRGVHPINYNEALSCLHAILYNHLMQTNVTNVVTVCHLNTDKLPRTSYFSKLSTRMKYNDESINLKEIKQNPDSVLVMYSHVMRLLSEVGVDEILPETPFFEGGLDSLSSVEFKNILEKKIGIKLSDTIIFDYPSVKLLSTYLLSIDPSVQPKKPKYVETKLFDPIAIIAMSCEYPQNIDTPSKLFSFLENDGDAMQEIPVDRFDISNHPDIYVNKGAFLETMMTFENERYHISDAEAMQMDPQQRKCLELANELISHLNPKTMENLHSTGVFVAGTTNATGLSNDSKSPYSATGASFAVLSNRISYTFGLKGPSMTIDTACSSSLVAIDVACKSLSNGDCQQAIVIGGNYLNVEGYIGTCSAKMLSPDGRCATFSSHANGYARSEGFGGIVLKRLANAVRDKDNICAVIKATAVVQDGRSANLTSPNGLSQENCISSALALAHLDVDDVDFVETHGTGTDLGDPIEVNALYNVFRTRVSPLPLGAVKSNMGHMEAGAGMIGVLKAIMCMQKKILPRNIHCAEINEKIQHYLKENIIMIPSTNHFMFDTNKTIFHAGISSFGFGGTNAHVIKVNPILLLRGETTFPQKCLHVVQETILPLIRKHNQQFNKDGFVIKFQEPDGKQLKRILVFAALLQFGQNIIDITKPQSNWLSYAEKIPQAAGIHTKTFSEYQQHHFK